MLFTVQEARLIQYDKLTSDDTVSATAHDFPAAFENILHVLPRTKLIAVVNGASPNERFWLGELQRETAFLAGRVELKFYNEMSFEQILADAAKLPPHSAIFWHLMNVDAAGVAHEAQGALKRLVDASNAPIFSQGDGSFGEGIVGGPMHSIQEGSEVAASVAVRIFERRESGRHQDGGDTFRVAEIRLESDATLGDSGQRPSARQHRFLQAAFSLGNLPLAVGDYLGSALVPRCPDTPSP